MSNLSALSQLAAAPAVGQSQGRRSTEGSFFEALAQAWGTTLDNQASVIETRANAVGQGGESPSQITQLTAEAMRMSFLTQSSSTSLDSVGKALETMARKN